MWKDDVSRPYMSLNSLLDDLVYIFAARFRISASENHIFFTRSANFFSNEKNVPELMVQDVVCGEGKKNNEDEDS